MDVHRAGVGGGGYCTEGPLRALPLTTMMLQVLLILSTYFGTCKLKWRKDKDRLVAHIYMVPLLKRGAYAAAVRWFECRRMLRA